MIIDFLAPVGEWPDARTLARCALSQRNWYSSAMKYLYGGIEILGKKQYVLLEDVLRYNKSIATKLQSLSVIDFTPAERISTTVFHTPQRLNGLAELFVLFGAREGPKEITTFPFRPSFLATLRQFHLMHHIYFYNIELESLDEIRKILGSLPNVESAIFRNVTWKRSSAGFKPLFNATSWRLFRFSLYDCASDFIAPFFWASPPPSCRIAPPPGSSFPPAICQQEVISLPELATLVLSPIDSTAESICWQWERVRETSECKISPPCPKTSRLNTCSKGVSYVTLSE